MKANVYCIAVYPMNDYYVVRKCCGSGYEWHVLENGGAAMSNLPFCNCEIVATKLDKEKALIVGKELSEEFNVKLEISA